MNLRHPTLAIIANTYRLAAYQAEPEQEILQDVNEG